jgi:DNA repair photolyase
MRHGSEIHPTNRFEKIARIKDFEQLDEDELSAETNSVKIEYFTDQSKSIVSTNNSPDIPFRYSLNPYRGCAHGCAYCYARNTHEYLGMDAGLDFETKIIVKQDAPRLFRDFLARSDWQVEPISFSGVTDCYQPAERQFQLTRQCIEVALNCRQPISIVTKNALVLRDLDLLKQMAAMELVHVFISISTLDDELARTMEPRTSVLRARLRAISDLAQAKVPVGALIAPIIPGLNDSEMPQVLEAVHQAGAQAAGYVLLRLPLTVEPVFLEWLRRTQPLKADKVEQRIRETRQGELNNSAFGERMRGSGEMAEQIRKLFKVFAAKWKLDSRMPPHNTTAFVPPAATSGQQWLY